jgi:putative ABC transport system permease protein
LRNVDQGIAKFNPQLFLHPMSKFRLYSDFEDGVNSGGRIEFVWLFGIIGVFVLFLACINFMNLSTARSEKRAKEVGIRKVVGSVRSQLISQFMSESLLFVGLAFMISLLLVQLALPWFNEVANKKISMPWTHYELWLFSFGIIFITALLSGIYPAFYLSAFTPNKVLKGTFRVGRYASIPRKMLVVVQFTVSITLVIGTSIVYEQIQFARNRPLGYNENGLLTIPMKTEEAKKHYAILRNELLATGTVAAVSKSECSVTDMWYSDGGFEWKGKDPNMQDILYRGAVDYEFGKTVGWKIKEGRDFSREFASDSSAMILNEAMVAYMGLENPIGETIKAYGRNYTVIGVVENMISQSLYSPVQQTFFVIDPFNQSELINVKINTYISTSQALAAIEKVFKKRNPATPFEYRFVDEQLADKYYYEARIGKLAGFFTILAFFISCLGLFGLASYMAEQRTKEIGIRKVLGASVFSLWQLLSKDFVWLVIVSVVIATPVAYYFMHDWLQKYEYRTPLAWWIFALAGLSAVVLTLLTVSYQTIKAALMNPTKSLRNE